VVADLRRQKLKTRVQEQELKRWIKTDWRQNEKKVSRGSLDVRL